MYQLEPSLRYTYTRNGIFYFSRWVPSDLRKHYTSDRIVQSLKTRSDRKARIAASMLAARLDEYWLDLRLRNSSPLFNDKQISSRTVLGSHSLTITEAKNLYLEVKGEGRSKVFRQSADRIVGYLVKCHGDRALDSFGGNDAAVFRDWLFGRGLSRSSVKRALSIVKAIVNLAISELGLECRNVFSSLYIPDNNASKARKPINGALLNDIQHKCLDIDDDLRWLVALLSDTGMRLGEAVGLLVDDIVLDGPTPYVNVQPHPHRTLKTQCSKRLIPLAGYSLWAARRIKKHSCSVFCFPRYNKTAICSTNSASATLNKWIKSFTSNEIVVHGFRHGMRDRLRAVEAPLDLIDQIGGWSLKSVGQSYGNGYSLEHCFKWLEKCVSVNASKSDTSN